MALNKVPAKSVHASSFGERKGFISPRTPFMERRDKEENLHLMFKLVILAVTDEFLDARVPREFEVYAEGEDIKTLQNAFPNGPQDITKEQAQVTVDVADEWFSNYKNENGDWVNTVAIRARSITLPNIAS
ncbi:hypothetical protein [Streptomyces violascens]|uniref:Uncharacterized protein n=1 Tax=Streptomyces violascens TaxID=67381 RepID=A0ABQ3QL23_9ACTN|nr:hypothetical protein [Streptomyces violascens]GGU44792.1 hypothetical protein GCM10010289_76740 [Streptomyces violascens]GHI37978.1 hypothetical protein Sviol_23860 [Streptomyces violascens]